ncbi:hypothetical protein D9M69_687130 [compost metagenome]
MRAIEHLATARLDLRHRHIDVTDPDVVGPAWRMAGRAAHQCADVDAVGGEQVVVTELAHRHFVDRCPAEALLVERE